jgi:hypothetical protein
MSATTPRIWPDVCSAYAYLEEPDGERVVLDTPAWTAWLDAPASVHFAYPVVDPARGYCVGVMTVRKERRQRGGCYWSAYRRQGGRVRKVYLGASASVTRARLDEVAHSFVADPAPPAPGTRSAATTPAPPDDHTESRPGSTTIPPASTSLDVTTTHPHSMDAAVVRSMGIARSLSRPMSPLSSGAASSATTT